MSIKYYVLAFRVSFHVNSSLVKPYDNSSSLYQKYTQPEKLIQSNHTQIISNATEIVGGEKNPYLMASKIYQFVVNTLTYEKQEEERGALWALQNKRGDCSEFSYLFVALCRAVDIPSRIHAGFAFHRDTQTLSDGHMWAEYYLENYGWVPVDPTWHLFDEIDSHHFSSLQSKPELTSYSNYFFNYSQVGSGDKPSDNQTIVAKKASIQLFNGFSSIQSMNNAVSKIGKAERMLRMAKLLGAHVFLSSDFQETEEKILNADFYVQEALEDDGSGISFAQQYADEALDLAESIVLKMIIVFVLFLVIVVVVVAVLHGRNRREQIFPYEYGY
ncbi:MAG: transglutaminase-like domain-containing protein [Thermoproteota archaeon]|nr:transglutaminase-like domain-containing protein [Thermoproteota archaeon]